ncbi:unnamed protein product, partial [Hapterophycus canaliculatus]
PTVFLGALWIPHRRNNADMETLLGSEEARGARCASAHARSSHSTLLSTYEALFPLFTAVICACSPGAFANARSSRAIFCHVDIKGAAMNDGVSSNSGIPRSAFPEGVPTFSGHFHKPHTVGGRDGFIRYVGSPYQVKRRE